MTDARTYLLATLQRVLDGGDVTNAELDAAISSPLLLDPVEMDAWEELSHWADDDDIRRKSDAYAEYKRDRMRDHIARLSA